VRSLSSKSSAQPAEKEESAAKRIWPYVVAAVMIVYVIALLWLVVHDVANTSAILRGA
jgi:hypothetical protein